MSTVKSPKPRPYWHVDAKWLTGILLVFLLSITFLVFLLVQLTAPAQGISILTVTLASSFSYESGGLDESDDIEAMQREIEASPDGRWQPIPGLEIFVTEQDIAGKTPREVRLWFFRQWAEPLYYEGAQGLAALMTDPAMKQSLEQGVGPLGIISAETHAQVRTVFAASGLVSLLFLGLLVLFSHRFGRLGSPGCVIFAAAVPGLILMGALRGWMEQNAQKPPDGDQVEAVTRYLALAADTLPEVIQKATSMYLVLVLLGLALMVFAFICSLIFRERKPRVQIPE